MRNEGRSSYDEKKDVPLVKWKVEIDKDNAWGVSLSSYDGAKPKLHVKRFYRGEDGQWYWPKKPDARFPYAVAISIVENGTKMEKAFAEWEKSSKDKPSRSERPDDDIPF